MISMLSNTAGKSVTTINWNINSHNIKFLVHYKEMTVRRHFSW